MSQNAFRFLTMWTLVIFFGTLFIGIILPKLIPLWFFVGVCCLMVSIGVIGTLVFNAISLHNKTNPNPSDVATDFGAHIFPVLLLLFFYPLFQSRFANTGQSFFKSALFPFVISLIYICTHDVEEIYSMSNLSSPVIIILTLCVWISSYPIFARSLEK